MWEHQYFRLLFISLPIILSYFHLFDLPFCFFLRVIILKIVNAKKVQIKLIIKPAPSFLINSFYIF